MYGTKMKEQFNIAYVCAMAAQAGLNHNHPSVDDDSVDITLSGSAFPGKVRNPHIDLQLKCTSQNLISGQVIKFPLKKKNYDDLRGDNLIHPRLLVVLLVSPDKDKWIEHHPEYMSLHRHCYWLSMKDFPDTKNENQVTVDIPIAQRLTTRILLQLMDKASNGNPL